MILLKSVAENLYWIGRYWARVQWLNQVLPIKTEALATEFCLTTGMMPENMADLNQTLFDPSVWQSLPANLNSIQQNLQLVRASIQQSTFESLHELSKLTLTINDMPMLNDALLRVHDTINDERPIVKTFMLLGQVLEQTDDELRQNAVSGKPISSPLLVKLISIVESLDGFILPEVYADLAVQMRDFQPHSFDTTQLYALLSQIHVVFERPS